MIKFADLKPGLQSTRAEFHSTQEAFGTSWDSLTIHEIIYVNKSEKELVLKVFSSYTVLTAEQFDSRSYAKPEGKFE